MRDKKIGGGGRGTAPPPPALAPLFATALSSGERLILKMHVFGNLSPSVYEGPLTDQSKSHCSERKI